MILKIKSEVLSRRIALGEMFDNRYWLIVPPVVMITLVLGLHFVVRELRYQVYVDVDNFWPISIFLPKYPVWQDMFVVLGSLLLWLVLVKLWIRFADRSILWLLGIAGVLVVATNLLQGWHVGLIEPVVGNGLNADQYWQDVMKIDVLGSWMEKYVWLQPSLETHTRTHPVGVLVYLYSLKLISSSALFVGGISLVLGLFGGWMIFDILQQKTGNRQLAGLISLLYVLSPAFQIYGWFAIDVVIASMFVGVFWGWWRFEGWWRIALTSLFLFLSSMLTFAVFWLLPMLAWDAWRQDDRSEELKRLGLTLGVWAGLLWLLKAMTGYNYWSSFLVARHLEAGHGSWALMLTNPSYYVTRIENVLEIVIFLGPWLVLILMLCCAEIWRSMRAWTGTLVIGILGLLLLFASGSYATGETARSAMYIYPFLMLLVGACLSRIELTPKQEVSLLAVVFFQSLAMQLFGWYFW